jgi:hypothetical protein
MPRQVVAISANGAGHGAGISLATLVAYASILILFPSLGLGHYGPHGDTGSACTALATRAATAHVLADEPYAADEDYYVPSSVGAFLLDPDLVYKVGQWGAFLD